MEDDILNAFNSEDEIPQEEAKDEEEQGSFSIKPEEFETMKILKIFQNKKILKKERACELCNAKMKIEINYQ